MTPPTDDWTLARAEAALPRVREVVRRIRELLAEARSQTHRIGGNGAATNGHSNGHSNGHHPSAYKPVPPAEIPAASTLEMELAAHVGELASQGITLRDPERGLIDFPARSASGREYLLCWLDGEDHIGWWHWPDAGFAGRTPISQPPD